MNINTYYLSFDIDFPNLTYQCQERIEVEHPDDKLVLDCVGLTIHRVAVNGVESSSFFFDTKNSQLVIDGLVQEKTPVKNLVSVSILFSGTISTGSLHGLYKSSYGIGYVLSTDLEPTGARRLFPCIDNPSFKAVFTVEVTVDDGLVVLSNTPSTKEETIDDLKKDGTGSKGRFVFEPTPRMSTYLFFLGVGKFDQVLLRDGNTDFIIATPPGQTQRGQFALENAVRFLRAFEAYFSIRYPLKKLHLVAIPEYPSGAMENWGAITFREIALLVDENTSESSRRSVALVVGHEIAHQWFGDLVTMKWWNDLWLNESFATFMESKIAEKLFPHWNVWSDFLLQLTAGALTGDSLSSTHPINVTVDSPHEVSQIFDEISYGKGASILRMVETYVGEEKFRQGVSEYLVKYSYMNAEGRNLWDQIGKASGLPVQEIMEEWIMRPGYPLVEISVAGDELLLKQHRFLLCGEKKFETPWPIPLTASLNGEITKFVMKDPLYRIKLQSKLNRLKINPDQSGFYRTLYDNKLYYLIKENFESFNSFDKWGIVDDLFAFLMSGDVEPTIYFDFVEQCCDETDYTVVSSISEQLRLLYFIAPRNERVKQLYSKFNNAQISRIGLEPKPGEAESNKILRTKIALCLAVEDTGDIAKELSSRFQTYETIDPNLRNAVAVAYARRSKNPKESFDSLLALMRKIGSEEDLIKIFHGLVSLKDPELVSKALDLSLAGEFNRADAIYTITSSAWNAEAKEWVWTWTKTNLSKVAETFTGTYILSSILEDVIPLLGIGRVKELEDYFSSLELEERKTGIKKGLELLEIYSSLAKRLQRC